MKSKKKKKKRRRRRRRREEEEKEEEEEGDRRHRLMLGSFPLLAAGGRKNPREPRSGAGGKGEEREWAVVSHRGGYQGGTRYLLPPPTKIRPRFRRPPRACWWEVAGQR
ncbi:hypothetical protein E2C01_046526 [Portunus trituberculatus]|uniref:Uncharacterized protein n=1 Tax=Portunus trituberculatus TaxID=210409 RepID=A0A5B7FY51_PORTR|nr:hypothetical protein [Portunus trituberculatus]